MPSRVHVAIVGLLASVAVSGILYLHFGTPVLLLVVPFVPILAARARDRPPAKACPTCGYRTRDPATAYCPRDGTALEED